MKKNAAPSRGKKIARRGLKASALLAALLALCLCSSACQEKESVFVLANIPFDKFFEREADSFDALSGATQKVANGALSYGLYHKKAERVEDSVFAGVTFPVRANREALEKSGFEKIAGDSAAFEITTSAKGKSQTVRYSGRQNLFQSGDYSYFVLDERPAYYKDAFFDGTNISFGKIQGEPKNLGTIYAAKKPLPKHTQGFEIVLCSDKDGTPLSFDDADTARLVGQDGDAEARLNSLRAVVALLDNGKTHGLTLLENIFKGNEIGAFSDSEIYGKKITRLLFVTEKGFYQASSFVVGEVRKEDGKNVYEFPDGAARNFLDAR